MTTTYTVICVQATGDSPRWYLGGRDLGRADQFGSDLEVHRLAAGVIAEQAGFGPHGLDHLISEGLAPGGSWTHAGYEGTIPIYRVVVPDVYLSGTECAMRVGIKPKTWSSYVARGYTPPPDAWIGGVPGWLPATVAGWQRPGQGARTDRRNAEVARLHEGDGRVSTGAAG